jgi:hypothetical protein
MTAVLSLSPGNLGSHAETVLVVGYMSSQAEMRAEDGSSEEKTWGDGAEKGRWAPNDGAEVQEIPRCAAEPFVAKAAEEFSQVRLLPIAFQLLFNKIRELRRPEMAGPPDGLDCRLERHRNLRKMRAHLSCESANLACTVSYAAHVEEIMQTRVMTPQDVVMQLRLKALGGEIAELRYISQWASPDKKGARVQLKMIPAEKKGKEGSVPHAVAAAADDSDTDGEEVWRREQESSADVHERVWSQLNSGGDGNIEWLQGSITFEAEGNGKTSHYSEPCQLAFGKVDWDRVQRRRAEFHASRSRSARRSGAKPPVAAAGKAVAGPSAE